MAIPPVFLCLRLLRLLPVALAFALLAAPALAQVRPITTADELREALTPGDEVSVVLTGGNTYRGRVRQIGTDDLGLRAELPPTPEQARPRLDTTIPFSAIQLLERPRDPVGDGALIGALAGAGVIGGMFIHAFSTDRNEFDEWGSSYLVGGLIYTGLGALIGAGIDGARSKPVLKYEPASGRSAKVRIAPWLGRGAGVRMLLSF
jgi:hypothetical protein